MNFERVIDIMMTEIRTTFGNILLEKAIDTQQISIALSSNERLYKGSIIIDELIDMDMEDINQYFVLLGKRMVFCREKTQLICGRLFGIPGWSCVLDRIPLTPIEEAEERIIELENMLEEANNVAFEYEEKLDEVQARNFDLEKMLESSKERIIELENMLEEANNVAFEYEEKLDEVQARNFDLEKMLENYRN